MSDTIISVEGLGKKYVLSHQGGGERGYARFSERLEEWVKRPFGFLAGDRRKKIGDRQNPLSPNSHLLSPSSKEEFWALKDVSFEVKRGEVVGIIGRNGAGKSTLLKILSRITEPTEGRVTLRGRVASLLEVGTGFHPELTGRENIFLNGAILGMTKAEIRKKFDEIVAFAEVERFLDTPVKRYSSGMYVRLAFAVAAHLEPEILVVDEVLAVGDAEFQKKCLGKMKEVSGKGGRTVLFVSHNMTAVRSLCSRAILLQKGKITGEGNADGCIRQYLQAGSASPTEKRWEDPTQAPGNGAVVFEAIRAVSRRSDGEDPSLFDTATPVDIEVELRVLKPSRFHVTLHFMAEQGVTAFTSGCTQAPGWEAVPKTGKHKLTCQVPAHLLNEGNYTVKLLLVEEGTRASVILDEVIGFDVKDLIQREVGSWHGREPGPVRPSLQWKLQ
jgi:lipopolysaccharide transport system ATP-binding protein